MLALSGLDESGAAQAKAILPNSIKVIQHNNAVIIFTNNSLFVSKLKK
jgi:hypothetical protein